MSMDAIHQVAEREEAARALRRKAQQEAQERVERAQQEGQERLDSARKDAMAQARAQLARGEAQEQESTRIALTKYQTQCEALKTQAEARLNDAAALIVGKVVKD